MKGEASSPIRHTAGDGCGYSPRNRTSTPVRVVTASCHEPGAAMCTSPATSLCVPIWHSPSSTMHSSMRRWRCAGITPPGRMRMRLVCVPELSSRCSSRTSTNGQIWIHLLRPRATCGCLRAPARGPAAERGGACVRVAQHRALRAARRRPALPACSAADRHRRQCRLLQSGAGDSHGLQRFAQLNECTTQVALDGA